MAIKFDLPSEIDSTATIISATLSLYRFSGDNLNPNSEDYIIVPVDEEWTESTINRNNMPAHFPHLAIDEAPGKTNNTWIDFDIKPAVQEQIKDPALNKGYIVVTYVGNKWMDMRSSEYETVELRPKLVIEYDNDPVQISHSTAIKQKSIVLYQSDGVLTIRYPFSGTYAINIFTITGRKIHTHTFSGNRKHVELPCPEISGTFLVELVHREKSIISTLNVTR